MRGKHERTARFGPVRLQRALNPIDCENICAGSWLVQQQQLPGFDEHPCKRHTLQFTAGKTVAPRVPQVREPDAFQRSQREAFSVPLARKRKLDVFLHAQIESIRLLRQIANSSAWQRARGDGAHIRLERAREQSKQRRLSAAVRADECERLAPHDGKRGDVEHAALAVELL
ncbi:hypothetical protein SDC9_156966 [bioreactor metagenome]|uniref:Uncharacterized protein n=1 Tax=bioreactor metagenome TaxID=1076179 RepID=A0A645F5Q3_9ZZZZ